MQLNLGKLFIESTFIIKQPVNQSLYRKYEESFQFYEARNINAIVNCNQKTLVYLYFVDMRYFIQQTQHVKRIYRYKTSADRPEISHRLRLCGQFYASHMPITYQIPMIFITKTQTLFIRRNRRIKKIKAGQGSSDDTQKEMEQELQPISQNFLVQLENSDLSEKISQFELNQSFQSEPHMIYDQQEIYPEESCEREVTLFKNRKDDDQNVQMKLNHLIIEMSAPNHLVGFPGEKDQKAFNGIQNQHKFIKKSSISIAPIEDKLSIKSFQKKSILSDYFGFAIDKPVKISDLGFTYQSPIFEDTLKLKELQIQKQRSDRASLRRKIRMKAQELLKRVRNEQQLY